MGTRLMPARNSATSTRTSGISTMTGKISRPTIATFTKTKRTCTRTAKTRVATGATSDATAGTFIATARASNKLSRRSAPDEIWGFFFELLLRTSYFTVIVIDVLNAELLESHGG